jgi:hypothetical protein
MSAQRTLGLALALSLAAGHARAEAPAPVPVPAVFGGAAIREIFVVDLPDTGRAELTPSGPLILYNPALLRAAGPAREFVRAHEAAHVLLAHLRSPWMLHTDLGRAQAEAEADCYAARASSSLAVAAMVRLVLRRAPEAQDALYGTKPARARRILRCAGISAS